MDNPLNRNQRSLVKQRLLEATQAVAKGERMDAAGMDVKEELERLRDLKAKWQGIWEQYGSDK